MKKNIWGDVSENEGGLLSNDGQGYFLKYYLFIWLHQVLVVASGSFALYCRH